MAYRDELETRLAHLSRLEARLAELKGEEARIRAMPGPGVGLGARVLGGPKDFHRELRVDHRLDPAGVAQWANEAFEIDGRVTREGDAVIWRGEPEPRPRRVEVRVEPDGTGTRVRVRDRGTYNRYAALFGLLGLLPQIAHLDSATLAFAFALFALSALALVAAALRRHTLRTTRRRIHQAERFLSGVAGPASETREVRVEVTPEDAVASIEPEVHRAVARRAR